MGAGKKPGSVPRIPQKNRRGLSADMLAKRSVRQVYFIRSRLAGSGSNPERINDKVKRRLRQRAVGYALEKIGPIGPDAAAWKRWKTSIHRAYSVIFEYESRPMPALTARLELERLGILTKQQAEEEMMKFLRGGGSQATKKLIMQRCGAKCKTLARVFLRGILGQKKYKALDAEVRFMLRRQKVEMQRCGA